MNVTTPDLKHHSHSRSLSHSLTATTEFKHLTASPTKTTKGKQREQDTWQFDWWDYVPLLEGNKPPAQWSSSSIIFTAHATEPRVVCSHYPSNRQFSLSSPPPLQRTPTSFEPPRVIATAAQDLWVFAYFPGIDGDGVGCVWGRGDAIDSWVVKDHWTFPRGAGVVTARWLSPEREWAGTDNGALGRLPTLGPYIPHIKPVLFAVTEAHLCTVLCLHPQTEQMQMHSVSLSHRSKSNKDAASLTGERIDGPTGLGRVTHAAIGFMYEESCFLVATRSSYVPAACENTNTKLADLSITLDMQSSTTEVPASSNWEAWRDENVIEVCEITVKVEAYSLCMTSRPLPAITNLPSQCSYLTGLTFVPGLPTIQPTLLSTPTLTHRNVTPQSSPAMANASVMQSPGRAGSRPIPKGSPPKPGVEKLRQKGRSILYLLCSTVDVEQYSTPPRSDITAVWYARLGNDWLSRRRPPLSFPSAIVTDLIPYEFSNSAQHANVLVATLDIEGIIMKHKDRKAVRSGKLSMLRMPECLLDESWEPTAIECSIDSFGATLPFTFVTSPNRALVCAVSSSHFSVPGSRTAIHPHPMQMHIPQDLGQQRKRKQLASSLTVALHKRVTSSDVAHVLSLRTTTLQMVEEVLSNVYADVEMNPNGLSPMLTNDLIGATVEVYRMRSELLSPGVEKEELQLRCAIGQELCSFYACIKAWEYLEFDGGYEMDAVWYLTGLCGYFLEVLQKLLKECVIFASHDTQISISTPKLPNITPKSPAIVKSEKCEDDLFSTLRQNQMHQELPSPISPIFLQLIHPYAFGLFDQFLGHICRFRRFLSRLTAKGENAIMAKEVLSDIFEDSSINLDALERVMQDVRPLVNSEKNKELNRRHLATLTPPVQCMVMFRSTIAKIMQAQVVDKARLFMKADDLVDGLLGLSLSSAKKLDRDIVSKSFLTARQNLTCVRCFGKSEPPIIASSRQPVANAWLLWEKEWHDHCVCGGMWITTK